MRICELPRSGGKGDFHFLLITGIRPKSGCSAQTLLGRTGKITGASIQVIDAMFVAGYEHLLTASMLAAETWEAKENISRSPATEILLFVSGERQIKEAIRRIGVTGESAGWIILAVSASESSLQDVQRILAEYGTEDDRLIELTEQKALAIMEKFGISSEDLASAQKLVPSKPNALKSLVLEKVSLSELSR